MDQFTRRIVDFGVNAGEVDGVSLCCMFNKTIWTKGKPQRLSSDKDPLFRYHQWQANLRILDKEEIKSVPYSPTSHPFVERLICTIQRELLNQLFFWNEQDLERKLADFARYYDQHRAHQALNRKTPESVSSDAQTQFALIDLDSWRSHCSGLFKTQFAA